MLKQRPSAAGSPIGPSATLSTISIGSLCVIDAIRRLGATIPDSLAVFVYMYAIPPIITWMVTRALLLIPVLLGLFRSVLVASNTSYAISLLVLLIAHVSLDDLSKSIDSLPKEYDGGRNRSQPFRPLGGMSDAYYDVEYTSAYLPSAFSLKLDDISSRSN